MTTEELRLMKDYACLIIDQAKANNDYLIHLEIIGSSPKIKEEYRDSIWYKLNGEVRNVSLWEVKLFYKMLPLLDQCNEYDKC